MIISKKLFFLILFFSVIFSLLLSFSLNFLWKPREDEVLSLGKGKNAENVQDLIRNLQNRDPLSRRNTIMELGKSRSKAAILPLFSMVMDSSTSNVEAELLAEALYGMTQGKILEYVVQLLSASVGGEASLLQKKKASPSSETESSIVPLNPAQIIHLIGILSLSNKEEIEKGKYNLNFLGKFLNSDNNAIVLATLSCISALLYEPLYLKVQALYEKNLYFKIPVIQILTKIGLNFEKHYAGILNFVRMQISKEEHPNVQEENYLALYMLNQHLLEVPAETEKFMKHIVGLDSRTLDSSLTQEYFLLTHAIPREEVSLVNFFLSEFVSPKIRFRLLNILWKQVDTDFLDISFLVKNLQSRYTDPKRESSRLELAKTSLQILGDRVEKREDLLGILSYLGDSRMSFSVVSAINRMLSSDKKKELLQNLYRSIVDDAYSNSALMSWVAYLGYRLQGEEGLEKQLSRVSDKNKLTILHDISDCHISGEDATRLSSLYEGKGEEFQKTLAQISTGKNVCYFG